MSKYSPPIICIHFAQRVDCDYQRPGVRKGTMSIVATKLGQAPHIFVKGVLNKWVNMYIIIAVIVVIIIEVVIIIIIIIIK